MRWRWACGAKEVHLDKFYGKADRNRYSAALGRKGKRSRTLRVVTIELLHCYIS